MPTKKRAKTSPSLSLGLMMEWLDGPYERIMLTHINNYCKSKGINLLTFDLGFKNQMLFEDKINYIAKLASQSVINGLIVLSGPIVFKAGFDFLLNLVAHLAPIPLVSIAEEVPGVPSILIDNKSAIEDAVAHLVTVHRCKKLAYIGGPKGNRDATDRESGFRSSLSKLGLAFSEKLHYRGDFSIEAGRKAVSNFSQAMDEWDEVDGIVAANDAMAIGALSAQNELVQNKKSSLHITGFDDDVSFYPYYPSGLTTLAQPYGKIAELAVESIIKLNRGVKPSETISLKSDLVVRHSCGCSYTPSLPSASSQFDVASVLAHEVMAENMRLFRIEMADSVDETLTLSIINNYLPKLGFDKYLFVLFGGNDSSVSRQTFSYSSRNGLVLLNDKNVRDLIREYCSVQSSQNSWIIEEISSENKPIGLFVIEDLANAHLAKLSEIRRIISTSLQRTFLFNELSEHAARQKENLRILEVYTSPSIIQIIESGDDPTTYLPEYRSQSVMFSDIRNFTTITSNLDPVETVDLLNDYFNQMNHCITDHQGEIDKLIGDAIMAVFKSSDQALASAVKMREVLNQFNEKRQLSMRLNNGIGLHYGLMINGNIGSSNKMDYTVIGDSVNTASRIESLTKHYGLSVLISEDFKHELNSDYSIRFVDEIKVKGRSQALKIYEVFDFDLDRIKKIKFKIEPQLETAYSLYREGHFRQCAQIYSELIQLVGPHSYRTDTSLDPLLNFYEERATKLAIQSENGLLPEWTGIYRFDLK